MSHHVEEIHIICTDPRIQKIYHDFLVKNDLFGKFDTIEHENPILMFLSDKLPDMVERIKAYIQLHGATKIVLIDHFDCGAYKLSGYQFADFSAEVKTHFENNKKAEQIIKQNFPDMQVEVKYINIIGDNCEWLDNPKSYF